MCKKDIITNGDTVIKPVSRELVKGFYIWMLNACYYVSMGENLATITTVSRVALHETGVVRECKLQ